MKAKNAKPRGSLLSQRETSNGGTSAILGEITYTRPEKVLQARTSFEKLIQSYK